MENIIYSLRQIAGWLLSPNEVSLPAIQRGFVWRPSQIENLWDSILRDYPIGAFMLTHEGTNKMLLDGQQRATSIALGFYNPWENEINRIGNAKNLPVLWLDVAHKDDITTNEFAFRVVTRSHPWGYQMKNNNAILSVNDRRSASTQYKEIFDVDVYTQLKPQQRLPYDACLPIPLCFMCDALLESNYEYETWKSIIVQNCMKYIPKGYCPKYLGDGSYHNVLEKIDLNPYFKILDKRIKEYSVPSIIVNNELIINNKDNSTSDPTLFVRLNSAGTKLDGEELMYSIYKAVCPQTKVLVENIGDNLIAPSRIISIASRFVLSLMHEKYVPSINLKQFQKAVNNNDFLSSMINFAGSDPEHSTLNQLIHKSLSILKGDGTIPDILIKKFIREAPNGLLLLINWLYSNGERDITLELKNKIYSRLYRLYWFGDLEYVISHTWDKSCSPNYWDEEYHNDGYHIAQLPLISPEVLEKFLFERLNNAEEKHSISADDESIWKVWTESVPQMGLSDDMYFEAIKNGWLTFLYKLLTNKSLVLLAQRNYINKEFKEFNQLEDLQDSNTPWDWDHIYPQSWVYYQQFIDDRTRRWEWRIGNLRAMSLTDNRSENNNLSPATRFKTINEDYFIKENDLEYWSKLTDEHKYIKKWDSEYVLIHAKAIIIRTVNIYRNFLNMIGYNFI